MVGVFFIATDWGRSNGGINSINDSLIKAFSRRLDDEDEFSWKLYCIVTKRMFNDEISDIENKFGISIITTSTPSTSIKVKKEIENNNFEQIFFIGHDIITGGCANELRDAFIANSMSIVFHHMNYQKYYFLRESNPELIRKKEEKQKEIISNADLIVPIGPYLSESAYDLCIDSGKDITKICEITPGLEKITPIEKEHINKKILLFGRIEEKNNSVKQINLAIAAISTYIKKTKNNNITIKCYGYEEDSKVNQKELMDLVYQHADKLVPVTANSYIKDEKELYEEIATSSLCIMPSYYEGFGLTAYEAIAAGVPTIISKNTGLYKFLNSWNGTPINGLYYSINISAKPSDSNDSYTDNDLNDLVECVSDILSNYDNAKQNALKLRKTLLDGRCTWEYTAIAFENLIKSQIKPIKATEPVRNPLDNLNYKTQLKLSELIIRVLIPKYCKVFCDTNKLICKVIKYSNDRERRFTVWSSDENSTYNLKILKYREIDNGTVGIMNKVINIDGINFPIIASNFVKGKCLLITNNSVKPINSINIGVPDHQVLCIIAVPIIHNNILEGALTFDIYDNKIIDRIAIEEKEFILKCIYQNLKMFSETLVNEFYYQIEDDIYFTEVNKMINNKIIRKRELVSFSGKCQLNCKHCFANEIVDENECENNIFDVLNSLEGKDFDVVYISHYKENFYNQEKGLSLCEEIYNKFHCDICITTRCVLNSENIERVSKLNQQMISNGNNLTFCISVPALNSYEKVECVEKIATPEHRIDFSEDLRKNGITSIVTIRPLFPSNYIPSEEIHSIVDKCENKVDAILTGGLCVNDNILEKLCLPKSEVNYLENSKSEYLIGVEKAFKEVNVKSEINDLQCYCESKNIPFFIHSMDALNYFKDIDKNSPR